MMKFDTPTDRLVWDGMKGAKTFFFATTKLNLDGDQILVDVYIGISSLVHGSKWAWCVSDDNVVDQKRIHKEKYGFDSKEDAISDLKKNYG